jgi:hypothetical protein
MDLDTDISYDGTSNLHFVWVNNDATWAGSHPNFKKTATENTVAAFKYADDSFPEIDGVAALYFPNMKLHYEVENEPVAATLIAPANGSFNVEATGSLTWTNGENTSNVDVYLSTTEDDVINNVATAKVVDAQDVETFDFSIDNASTYFWKVVATNDISGLTATSSVWSFTTELGNIELPLSYDYEDMDADTLPLGWASIVNSSNEYAGVGVNTSEGMRLYNSGDENAELIAITPEFDGTGARAKFMVKSSASSGTNQLIFGTITDTNDSATFTEITTLDLTNEFTLATIELTAGENKYAFKHNCNGTYKSIYIDNLVFEVIPENEPVAATLTSPENGVMIEGLEATLEWTNNENTVTVDVYFSANLADVENKEASALVVDSQDVETFTATTLDNLSRYFWRVIAKNENNYPVDSEIFSFFTKPEAGNIITGFGAEVNNRVPMDCFFDYNYSQSIYPAAQIGVAGEIEAISYQWNGNSELSHDVVVYMAHTSETEFAEVSSWLPIADFTEVYNGTFSLPNAEGWVTITLDTPFAYDGSSNLAIAFDENTDGYSSNDDEFFGYAVEHGASLAKAIDDTNVDPASPLDGVIKNFLPNTIFTFGETVEPLPVVNDLAAVVENENDVVLTWTAPVSDDYTATEYMIEKDGAELATVTELTYTDADLVDGTYAYTVKAVYAEGTAAASNEVSVTISTTPADVEAPVNLTASVTGQDVTLNWLAPGTELPSEITEGFEGDFAPEGWTVDATDTESTWAQEETIAFDSGDVVPTEGTYQAGVRWSYSAQDEWLITPEVTGATSLSFDYYGSLGSVNGDNYYVKVSTDGGSTWTAVWNATDFPEGENHYATPIVIDLSDYAGNIQIAWNFVDGDGAGLWFSTFIDNVVISTQAGTARFAASDLTAVSKAPKTSRAISTPNRFAKDENYVVSSRNVTREMTGYKVYRDGTFLADVAADALTYTDAGLDFANYEYHVTAIYTEGESEASNTVEVSIVDPSTTIPPMNLEASVNEDAVTLTWEAPLDLSDGAWMQKSADENNDGIGTGAAAEINAAIMYTEEELAMYQGLFLNKVKFFPREATATYTIKIWGGAGASTELYSQDAPDFLVESWNEVVLNETVAIPAAGPLYIGYAVNTPAGYPIGCDAGPAVAGGDMIQMGEDAWAPLSSVATIDVNWNIAAFATPEEGDRTADNYVALAKRTVANPASINSIAAGNLNPIVTSRVEAITRDVTAYK